MTSSSLTAPIQGIDDRSPREVFAIMVTRIEGIDVRARLEKLRDLEVLPMYEMEDDRGLTMDEYIDLFKRVLTP